MYIHRRLTIHTAWKTLATYLFNLIININKNISIKLKFILILLMLKILIKKIPLSAQLKKTHRLDRNLQKDKIKWNLCYSKLYVEMLKSLFRILNDDKTKILNIFLKKEFFSTKISKWKFHLKRVILNKILHLISIYNK